MAEVQAGKNEKSVVMVAVARPEPGTVQASGAGVVLRKELLWKQEEAILDVVMLLLVAMHRDQGVLVQPVY